MLVNSISGIILSQLDGFNCARDNIIEKIFVVFSKFGTDDSHGIIESWFSVANTRTLFFVDFLGFIYFALVPKFSAFCFRLRPSAFVLCVYACVDVHILFLGVYLFSWFCCLFTNIFVCNTFA